MFLFFACIQEEQRYRVPEQDLLPILTVPRYPPMRYVPLPPQGPQRFILPKDQGDMVPHMPVFRNILAHIPNVDNFGPSTQVGFGYSSPPTGYVLRYRNAVQEPQFPRLQFKDWDLPSLPKVYELRNYFSDLPVGTGGPVRTQGGSHGGPRWI